ncbi:hypothetical protein PI124_g20970 [Phytophthora idaei]|nr:hypothetical protein PI125_g21970 [Phytophthora idaei]KAG3130953.1 hypothetical protein PI126_g20266 [Phytophthora idaei]KAG3233967.1 hypothetical protein PI124_g20970 [Phytophthora idaei]
MELALPIFTVDPALMLGCTVEVPAMAALVLGCTTRFCKKCLWFTLRTSGD